MAELFRLVNYCNLPRWYVHNQASSSNGHAPTATPLFYMAGLFHVYPLVIEHSYENDQFIDDLPIAHGDSW